MYLVLLFFGLYKMLLSLKSLPLLIYFQYISLNWQPLSTPYVTVAIRNTLNYKQEKNLIVGLEYKIYFSHISDCQELRGLSLWFSS